MNWSLIIDGHSTGQKNMTKDLSLVENLGPDQAFLRFYQWKPYCISLGYNQKIDDFDLFKAKKDGIDIVHRPTGGRAILHSEEITYSVGLPLHYGLKPKEIYEKISRALIKGLINLDAKMSKLTELEKTQPHFPALLNEPQGILCFASSAKNEIKISGQKIIGSAQRKLKNTILQHGSVLVGKYHRKLPNYIKGNKKLQSELRKELTQKTIELETILGYKVNYIELISHLVSGFEEEFAVSFY